MALFLNAFSISAPRTGDADIQKLNIVGWSNNDNLEDGRLYWKVTAGNVLEMHGTELRNNVLCSGAIHATEDTVTLAEVGGSGLSGTAIVVHTLAEESTGEVTLSYCNEDDLLVWEKRLANDYLDSNGVYLVGTTRFEQPLKRAKVTIDKMISNKLEPFFRLKANKTPDLTAIAIPRELADVHALYTLFLIYMGQNSGDDAYTDLAKDYKRMSRDELDLIKVTLDFENDDIVDDKRSTQGARMKR